MAHSKLGIMNLQDRLEWFLRMNSAQPYCNSTGCSTDPPGRTCVHVQYQQDIHSLLVCWTKVESVGREDGWNILKICCGRISDRRRHRLLGNCVFWQPIAAGSCHLEPSVSKLMEEETEPTTIIGCIRHDSPGASGWMNTASVETTERCCQAQVHMDRITIKNISTYLQSHGKL